MLPRTRVTLSIVRTLPESEKRSRNMCSFVVYLDYAQLPGDVRTAEPQWLEHQSLIYHGYFEFVLESLGKNPIAADIIIFEII